MIAPRRRRWQFVTAACVGLAAAGCGGTARAPVASIRSPACTTKVASATPELTAVHTKMIELAGSPFGVATTRDGRWSFVDELGPRSAVAVFSDADASLTLVRTVDLHAQAVGSSLTADGRYLLAANGDNGAVVLGVARLESGAGDPVLGTLARRLSLPRRGRGLPGVGAIETATSPDGRFAFVSVEYGDSVAVYDLHAALADGFSRSSYVGAVPLGHAVVGMAVSRDGRWLYVTSELQAGGGSLSSPGTLSVISIATAEKSPAHSVVSTVDAGCQPVRVALSPDGRTVWVTARASDALLAFSAARLLSSPARALLAAVRVGEAPVGVAVVDGGRDVVVANSNRFGAPGAHSSLTVVDSARALAHKPSVVGSLPAGTFPREMAASPTGGCYSSVTLAHPSSRPSRPHRCPENPPPAANQGRTTCTQLVITGTFADRRSSPATGSPCQARRPTRSSSRLRRWGADACPGRPRRTLERRGRHRDQG